MIYGERLNLVDLLRNPNAAGRNHVLFATDELLAPGASNYLHAPTHVLAVRTREVKLVTYSHWTRGTIRPVPAAMKLEFYDYATSTGRAETRSHPDDPRVKPLLSKLFSHYAPTQMQAPLPDSLKPTVRRAKTSYLAFQSAINALTLKQLALDPDHKRSHSRYRPPASPAYANTTWPTEHADVWRSHAAPSGLPAGVGRMRLRTAVATLPPAPVWGYVGRGRAVYVIGGSPYLLNMFTALLRGAPMDSIPILVERGKAYSKRVTPYVARIDTKTMRVRILLLRRGTSINYTGGMLVDSNGFLYAVSRSVLYKIDPATFRIIRSRRLPLAPNSSGKPNEMTAYNGMAATRNGDLILKGWASSGGGNSPPAILLRLDPASLSIKARLVTTAVASARMALAGSGGKEYLYFPGPTESLRMLLRPHGFTLDSGFTKTYLKSGSGATTASSDVFMGDAVVFSDNTIPGATTPMHLFAEAASGSPLEETQAFRSGAAGWNFFMVGGDPYRSGIVVVEDQLNGGIAGYRACTGGHAVSKLWENDSLKPSAGIAIDYRSGQLYTDNRVCKPRRPCRLFLDVLDLRSGTRLTQVRVRGRKPSIGQIFIAPQAVYYVASDIGSRHGFVTRVTVHGR
jgi:hypothetical protein